MRAIVFFAHATCHLRLLITTWWELRVRPISAPKWSARDGGSRRYIRILLIYIIWVCRKIWNLPNFIFYLFIKCSSFFDEPLSLFYILNLPKKFPTGIFTGTGRLLVLVLALAFAHLTLSISLMLLLLSIMTSYA